MSILAWIEDQRRLKLLNASKYNHPASDGSRGLWTRCDNCGVILYIKHLKENQRVCFGCGYHLQMNSQERIEHLIDFGSWRPLDETLSPCDPLEFRDQKLYTERLKEAQERTGLQDAVQTGTGLLDGIPIALGVMDFHFMGGSMGSVVGEKITRLIEYATQQGLTLILVCASGGARMQEGILSLMQMAKISAALQIYQSCANLLYISVLTSPTTGGVTASFAMLGDLIFSEPKALIGFAGRRVIEQTLQEQLPDDFQTAEYLLHHGLLDLIISRSFFKQALSEIITLYKEAPFKKIGYIPHGMINTLNSLTEEKVRQKWVQWSETNNNLNFLNELFDKEKKQTKDMFLEVSPQIRYKKEKLFTTNETDFTNNLKIISVTSDMNTTTPVDFKKIKLEWMRFANQEFKIEENNSLAFDKTISNQAKSFNELYPIDFRTFLISIQGDFRFWQDLNLSNQNQLEEAISFANQSVFPWYATYKHE